MKRINENIAYAKSILNKSGISSESEEYKDYLRIRELCDRNHVYVRVRDFHREVMDAIESERLGMKPKVEPSVEKLKEDTNKKVGGFWDFFRGRK